MAINSNRTFKSRETGRRYRVEDNDKNNKDRKYAASIWCPEKERYVSAVNGLGDSIVGRTIADVQRAVNAEDFWITTWEQWLES